MTSTDHVFEMADTLIVLAGGNAWAAARAFGSDLARDGKAELAREWRNVARAVLRKQAAHNVVSPQFALATSPAFDGLTSAAAEVETPVLENAGAAPIPLRARRQLAMLAKAQAMARAETGASEFAKAA